ncbi:hypothetical protein F5877DRAFT_80074 [Lentinula edodes]|nr:hypothetical protein F5877DRAFT_80074 [Lentinula edodes]
MVQMKQLPGEVCKAIQEFDKFQNEHPYIIAGASVALIIGIEPILSKSFIGMLVTYATSPGSWAAALQSTFYGPNTTGLFSILQHVAMSAKCTQFY